MPRNIQDEAALEALNHRVRTLLPEQYQDCYEDVQPISMSSAGLKYGRDGMVAWNEMWGSFCDLAMAGGPPHKGTLLQQAPEGEIHAEPDKYRSVTQEICRGIESVTDLAAEPSSNPGWVLVSCVNRALRDGSYALLPWKMFRFVAREQSLNCQQVLFTGWRKRLRTSSL
jgi:hypothetical protein